MRLKHVLVVIVVLTAGVSGFLFRKPQQPRGPTLECGATIDFGVRDHGEIASAPFIVTNVGDQPLFDVLLGAKAEQTLTIKHEGTASFSLERVTVSDASVLSAELLPPSEPAVPPSDRQVRVAVVPQRSGSVEGHVTVYFRRAGVAMTSTVLVSARCVEAFTAVPSRVLLPKRSQAGWVYETTVLCRSHTGKAFSLHVEESPEDLSVEAEGSPPQLGTRLVRVKWKQGVKTPGPWRYKVVLLARDADREVRLPIEVEYARQEAAP